MNDYTIIIIMVNHITGVRNATYSCRIGFVFEFAVHVIALYIQPSKPALAHSCMGPEGKNILAI